MVLFLENGAGKWWNNDVEELVKQGNKLGLPPNMSDAHTINGKPCPLFPCSEKHTYALEAEQGKTYLLRIINAALNDELFFAITGHNMTVIFHVAARPFMDAPVSVDNKTATAILQYKGILNSVQPVLPQLPALNNTAFALNYDDKLRSLNTAQLPANLPLKVDRHLFYTICLGINPCRTCLNGTQLTASLNSITFVMPKIGLLQAHFFNTKGVFITDFPDRPPTPFNYTGATLTANLGTKQGTRFSKIAFNSTVDLVLQDTNLLTVESHPFHLHGYNFFVVGSGIGNFDPKKDPTTLTWLTLLRETQWEFPLVVGLP
ncbi:laccase-11-like [Pyrus ussuriensis x Pyrus communis]|uniref:Laccase-11-like n=1 Tax=Pyrus ussuriensis x Pyrus communis TaxID=2448454 RepID=A0A5N5I5K9_9ROSA|nr:laccase-11-like [Pyrus ussuriensis x Pyrus communis]